MVEKKKVTKPEKNMEISRINMKLSSARGRGRFPRKEKSSGYGFGFVALGEQWQEPPFPGLPGVSVFR